MTRIISFASGKGGVGKTTIVANLAAALAKMGYNVYAIDCNITTANLGLHLGMYLYPKTLHDMLAGKANVEEVIYEHFSGFKIIPADISLRKIRLIPHKLMDGIYTLVRDADFVLIDSAAGIGEEARIAISIADELLTVSNPEIPAIVDAAKINMLAKENETKITGIVINRVEGKRYEMKVEEIEEIVNSKIIGKIPEDKHVKHAISKKIPVVIYKPKSKAAKKFNELAYYLAGEKLKEKGLLNRLFSR